MHGRRPKATAEGDVQRRDLSEEILRDVCAFYAYVI